MEIRLTWRDREAARERGRKRARRKGERELRAGRVTERRKSEE